MIIRLQNNKPIFFVLVSIWFSLEYVILGQFSYIRVHEVFEGPFINYAVWANNILKYGDAQWLPNLAGGVDSASATSSGLLSFVNLILPTWIAYQVLVVLKFFLAGYGGYLLNDSYMLNLPIIISEILSMHTKATTSKEKNNVLFL